MTTQSENIFTTITTGYRQIRDDYAKNPEKARKARRLFQVIAFVIGLMTVAIFVELIRK